MQVRNRVRQAPMEWRGGRGVIYLSWHSVAPAGWSVFAEEAIAAEMEAAAIVVEEKYWIHNDLFLLLRLPSGGRSKLEGWLLEQAIKRQAEWESRFREMEELPEARLLAGVSIIEDNLLDLTEQEGNADRIYEAMKRAMVHGQRDGSLVRSMKLRALEQLIAEHAIMSVYQPIMSLQSEGRSLFGYEALARFTKQEWFAGPQQLFAFAEQEGLAYRLDRLARRKALDGIGSLKPEQRLFINVQAQIINDPHFTPGRTLSMLERRGLSPHNVVFEITERTSIDDFGAMKKALEHYRNQGFQIAIDDVGAGYSSLQSIVELRPDYIKVDRSIIDRIDEDDVKLHILHTLVQLAYKLDVSIIAEGIEREEELAAVKKLGVHYAQGYLLGRPGGIQ
ncbi:EAL domain-containing protein [Paenibacillus sp. NPDC058174]|uniref:EAL domain-containing protein n=1 Tax=Paenibacillus sp. NPDC058174 TaxID=3346366 RepID=UPI0036DDA659